MKETELVPGVAAFEGLTAARTTGIGFQNCRIDAEDSFMKQFPSATSGDLDGISYNS